MKKIIVLLFVLGYLEGFTQETSNEYEEAIENHGYPQWFKEAKLGIFIHWGLYSVPAYGGKESYAEWFLKGLQDQDSLRTNFVRKHYGPNFTYKDFANEFKAELFNPYEWADIFKESGAKYVVLVSKHHDGYALWPSKFNRNWNSVDTGPKRDIVGELTTAVREKDLKMGLYYSLAEWNHPLHRWYTDPHDSIGDYVEQYMVPQFKELITEYKPSLIFADGEWYNTAKQWRAAELINWYYKTVGEEAIVNDRWGHGLDVGFLTPEYSSGILETKRPWAEVRGIGRSFGLNRNEDLEAYGTGKELIQRFAQTVANGGGMILNVGPRADGQIPMIQQKRLKELGTWLKVNGEAIYGAQAYGKTGEEKETSIERIDSNINFNWVRNSPVKGIREDDFTITWQGYIVAPKTGNYTFEIEVDDEAMIEIGGNVIINSNYTAPDNEAEVMGSNTGMTDKGTMRLKAGEALPIRINYREKKQNAKIKLYWKYGDFKQIVPANAFYLDIDKKEKGLKGIYTSQTTYLSYTQNNNSLYAISYEWPDEQLILDVEKPAGDIRITLLGLDRELPWQYENNKLIINTSNIKYGELPGHDAWTFKIQTIKQE